MNKKILFLLICIMTINTGCGQMKETSDTGASSDDTEISSEADSSSTEDVDSTDDSTSTDDSSSTDDNSSTDDSSSTGDSSSTDDGSSNDSSSKDSNVSSEDVSLPVEDVAFVGDSRTLSMASGGELQYYLIPGTSVFAAWGGKVTDDRAKTNTLAAANADKKMAVFWFGINDVQSSNLEIRDDATLFCSNYEAIIDLYRQTNPDSRIVILSILTTSIYEKDY